MVKLLLNHKLLNFLFPSFILVLVVQQYCRYVGNKLFAYPAFLAVFTILSYLLVTLLVPAYIIYIT